MRDKSLIQYDMLAGEHYGLRNGRPSDHENHPLS